MCVMEKKKERWGIVRYALKSGVRSLGLDLSFGFWQVSNLQIGHYYKQG